MNKFDFSGRLQAQADHSSCDLEQIFRHCFYAKHRTLLVGGSDEPFYSPLGNTSLNSGLRALVARHKISCNDVAVVFYTSNYYASALHEVSHWCIAGEERRRLVDFGYWYVPDGRNASQQQAFQRVEIKPQALELLFSLVSQYPFHVSLDNLGLPLSDAERENTKTRFTAAVCEQAIQYLRGRMPTRAHCFIEALAAWYDTTTDVDALEAAVIKAAKIMPTALKDRGA